MRLVVTSFTLVYLVYLVNLTLSSNYGMYVDFYTIIGNNDLFFVGSKTIFLRNKTKYEVTSIIVTKEAHHGWGRRAKKFFEIGTL